MTASMSRRIYNLNVAPAISQTHKDITDEKVKDLRRPRKVRFYVNGDRYFKGKKLYITPHRYFNFNDLLNDLTGKLPSSVSLPYGVRQIFTPSGGHRVIDLEELIDGQSYVCAGFEGFKPQVRYGLESMEPWSMARPHNHDLEADAMYGHGSYRGGRVYGAFQPGPYLQKSTGHRRYPGTFGAANRSSYLPNADVGQIKPKVITIVRNGARPRNNIKILLNRRSVQSFEQLMSDVSEAFGPKYRNNKLEKLFTIRGREVQGISDFFRDDDVFVAVGNEKLSEGDLIDIIEEIFPPDTHTARMILKDLDKQRRKRQAQHLKEPESDKRDSGFGEGSDGSNRDLEGNDYVIYKGRPVEKGRRRHDYPKNDALANRLEKDKDKAVYEERDRAKRRQQNRMEAERRALDDERRKRGLVPKAVDDPYKRSKEQKDRDKDDQKRKREDDRQKKFDEEEREKQKHEQDREKALEAARERRAAAERAEKERAEKEKAEKEKMKEKDKNRQEKDGKSEKDAKSEKDDKEDKVDKDMAMQKKKKSKSKIVRKTKLERQVSSDNHILSRYELGKTLGDGNFAVVKQATLKNTKNEFAMKIIDKSKLKGKEHMVEHEIEIMKDCHHPNIVKLYEEYETVDKIYLVMELVKGGDLFDAITQSVKFGEVDSAHMVKDLCNALFYLHARSIVHRDLKPENLLVHRNKDNTITLKLADFGLAMDVRDPIYTVCGTPTYVAPEILSEIGYGLEVDMWAVGVIGYILLCGFPPFRSADRNQTELFEFIKGGEYEFLSPYWDHISKGAKDIIEHLLIVDKKKRYTAIDTLSHPWIMYNGDMGKITDNAELEKLKTKTRSELEALATTSYDSYMKVKEKRG